MKAAWRKERADKFGILHRDMFACRYCSAMPGSDFLEVDHLIPRAKGGSDHEFNLVAACKTCNSRKSDTIVFPHDMIERQDDDGWYVHKSFGVWAMVFCCDDCGIDNSFGYGFIHGHRVFDDELVRHIAEKNWSDDVLCDLRRAFDYLRLMLREPTDF